MNFLEALGTGMHSLTWDLVSGKMKDCVKD